MMPGNVGVIEIAANNQNLNPALASKPTWFFRYNDPQLGDKITKAISEMDTFESNCISQSLCIDPTGPN